MNRHYFNFIAAFNSACKTKKWTFVAPLRNKFVWVFLNYLAKEKLIEDFSFVNSEHIKFFNNNISSALVLGKKHSAYYCPIKIHLKHEFISKIHTISSPGERYYLNKKELALFAKQKSGKLGVVICSSSKLKRLCTANELIRINEGGFVLCVVNFY